MDLRIPDSVSPEAADLIRRVSFTHWPPFTHVPDGSNPIVVVEEEPCRAIAPDSSSTTPMGCKIPTTPCFNIVAYELHSVIIPKDNVHIAPHLPSQYVLHSPPARWQSLTHAISARAGHSLIQHSLPRSTTTQVLKCDECQRKRKGSQSQGCCSPATKTHYLLVHSRTIEVRTISFGIPPRFDVGIGGLAI